MQIESDKEECRVVGTPGACNNYAAYRKDKNRDAKSEDNQRKREAILNDFDTLVDKNTGLSLRLLTFNVNIGKEMLREKKKENRSSDGFTNEIEFSENNIVHGFFLDPAVWGKLSRVKVIHSTPEYIYFQTLVYSSLHINDVESLQKNYYLYDRKYSDLFALFDFYGPYKEWNEPSLVFNNGKYKFNWKGADGSAGNDISHVFYEFFIDYNKKTKSNFIVCTRHWDEGCEIKLFNKKNEHREFKMR